MLVATLAAVYLFDLANTPVYFGGDEAHFAVEAHALATTGRNLRGDLLPVFVNLADPLGEQQQEWGDTYYQPLLFYVIVGVIKFLPMSITAVRLPVAVIGGIITPLLIYGLALRVMGAVWPAVVTTLLLALAPTHVVLSRQALDYVCPLPFVIGWLWCLHAFTQSRRPQLAALAGVVLGIGCYSYIASWAMMPGYLILTLLVMRFGNAGLRTMLLCVLGFAVPVSVGATWVLLHPEMLAQTAARYGEHEGPAYGLVETYLSFVKPTLLFVRGGPSLTTSTARSGFVLLATAPLLVAGIAALWRRRDWLAVVIVAGIVAAPIPAALKGEPGMIQRAIYMLPFLALLGGFGFAWLWSWPSRIARAGVIALLALVPIQFAYFYFDYFTHYKLRSAFYYDPAAFRDVAAYLMTDASAPSYVFTEDVDDVSVKWRFYVTQAHQDALLPRARYVAPGDTPSASAGSLLVTLVDSMRLERLGAAGWRLEKVVADVDNRPATAILRKAP